MRTLSHNWWLFLVGRHPGAPGSGFACSGRRPAVRPGRATLAAAAAGASYGVRGALLLAAGLLLCLAGVASAGTGTAVAPDAVHVEPVEPWTEAELEALVAPVALYPDDLLAIVLPAATFPLQVVLAARFLEAREADPELEPDAEWDASVVALLNYPEVVALLDRELNWTWKLGEAVLLQQEDVIAAVAGFRTQAAAAGNLKSDEKQVVSVSEAGAIEIAPVEREVIYVPYYDPVDVVSYQPRRVYHYYPQAYPVYYYPYPSGHYFSNGPFWGVTSAFSIGWYSRSLHWHHHGFHDHPYFGYSYYDPFYYRRPHVWLNVYHQDRLRRHDRRHHDDNRWRNDDRHGGSRPGRRPDRRVVASRPASVDERAPGVGNQVAPPRIPAGRGIERSAVAMPDKKSAHIPVNTGGQRPARRAAPAAGRTPGAAQAGGARRLTSATRPRPPNDPSARQTGSTARPAADTARQSGTNAGPTGTTGPRLSAGSANRPAGALANLPQTNRQRAPSATRAPARRPATGARQHRAELERRGASAPPRVLRQRPADTASSGRSPRAAAPLPGPARVQRPAASSRLRAQERPSRASRPPDVRKPAPGRSYGVQPRQQPRASSPGSGTATTRRGSPPAAPRNSMTSAIARGAAKRADPARQSPRAGSSVSRNAERVSSPPPETRVKRDVRQQRERHPNRRRPDNRRANRLR